VTPPALKVSLIVPLRDEEGSAGALLESIGAQDHPPDEVVVVDAGSTDRTASVVSAFAGPFRVRLVRAGPLFPGAARNLGVESAAHPWLAFTDGGIRLEPGWLAALLGAAQGEGADAVLGSYDPVCETLFTRASAVAYVPGADPSGFRAPFVASMALTRSAFQAAGGFPPFRAAEDLIFLERLRALPLRIVRVPAAVVHWQLAPDFRRTYRRFALYSEHNLRAGRGRHWHAGVLRHYAAMAILGTGAALAGAGAWSLAVYPAWQVARAARSAWLKRGGFRFPTLDPRHVLLAAAILCVIDLATLAGAIRWWRGNEGRAG